MKKIFLIICICTCSNVFAEQIQNTQPQQPATVSQNIPFENCTKIFNTNQERLFYLTLASISENKFSVEEIQTSNGYIIFSVNRNKYLATIGNVDSKNAILKIL